MGNRIDLTGIPVVDAHCHLFAPEPREMDFSKVLSLSLQDMPLDQTAEVLSYKRWLRYLKDFTGAEKDLLNSPQVIEAAGFTGDYRGYVEHLFKDACLDRLIVDLGYVPTKIDVKKFESFLPIKLHYIYRIETFLDPVWANRPDFDKMESEFIETLATELKKENVIGVKSIIGYRTGLEIKFVEREEAKQSYQKGDEKVFRDYFFRIAADLIRGAGKVFQVHTGFGESNLEIEKNNPVLMKDFIERYQEPADLQIHLVHGGYPYAFQAGYLAGVFPNVWVDISVISPWLVFHARDAVTAIMEMAPLNKIMHGSDGFVVPELGWYGAKVSKDVLGDILESLVEQRIISIREAEKIALNILCDNAKRLYKL